MPVICIGAPVTTEKDPEMPRILTALALSATMIATAPAAFAESYIQPYRANEPSASINPGAIISGLIALGLIAAILDDDDPLYTPAPQPTRPPKPYVKVKPVKPQAYRHALPERCVRQSWRNGKPVRLLGRQCLRNERIRVGALPKACLIQATSPRGKFTGFSAPCLRARGYKIAHR